MTRDGDIGLGDHVLIGRGEDLDLAGGGGGGGGVIALESDTIDDVFMGVVLGGVAQKNNQEGDGKTHKKADDYSQDNFFFHRLPLIIS